MAKYTFATLEKMFEKGMVQPCISTDDARILIPTACKEPVRFTNPDDLGDERLKRWLAGERGPEFENQVLQPGECLVLYNKGGANISRVLEQYPDWHKSVQGIQEMVARLYPLVDKGANLHQPAIWNSHFGWTQESNALTASGEKVTREIWEKSEGRVLEIVKKPAPQWFISIRPGDALVIPPQKEGDKPVERTAGAFSAILVRHGKDDWAIVQLGAKGYAPIVQEEVVAQLTTGMVAKIKQAGRG